MWVSPPFLYLVAKLMILPAQPNGETLLVAFDGITTTMCTNIHGVDTDNIIYC